MGLLAPIGAIVAIAAPAAISALVARRWLIPAMLLWFFSPAIVFLALDLVGKLIGTPAPEQPGSAIYALLLVGSFLLIPWLLICLAGFGLGFALRGRFRATPSPIPSPTVPAPVRAPMPPPKVPIEMAGWRERHVGFEDDELRIDGLKVWGEHWRPTGMPPVQLPHPAHPDQRHRYDIYEIGEAQHPTRFAAGELSNGVWGFYVPVELPVETQGASADGTLRYEHRLGEFANGRYDSVSSWAVLIDAATDRVLVDCAGWASSRISTKADGCLFLHLQQNQFETLFRIDPATRRFRDQGLGGEERPLAELPAAVEDAWQATARHDAPPHYRRISPDGTIRVDLASEEWSNSHWVNAPKVIEIASGRVLLDLWGTDWDASVSFPRDGAATLACRRYHLGGSLSVTIDLVRGCYGIVLDPQAGGALAEAPLDGLAQGLEAASHRAAAAGGADRVRTWRARPHPLAAWRTALLILASALIAVAAIAYVEMRVTPAPVQTLTPMPKMPDFTPKQ